MWLLAPAVTLPLAGRVGEGGAARSSLAKKLRAVPTASEVRLWRILHTFRTDGFHFRKQVAVGAYVVDFACLHAGLVIEVDGATHDSPRAISNDATRDDYLAGRGFTVLRLPSDEVMRNADGTYALIAATLEGRPRNRRGSATPLPSSPARGEVSEASSTNLSATLPLARSDGEGGDACSNPDEDHQ